MVAGLRRQWTGGVPLFALVVVCVAIGVITGVDPKYGLLAAFAVLFLLVTFADVTLGFILFTLASFLDLTSAGSSVSGTKVIGLALFGSWVARVASRRERPDLAFSSAHPKLAAALIAMLAWATLSFVWASSASTALGGAGRYALNMVLFPIAYTAMRERRHVRWVIGAFVIGAVVSGAYGLIHPTTTGMDTGRLTGLNGDANGEATVLAEAIPLLLAMVAVSGRSAKLRAMWTVGLLVLVIGLVETLSREGLLSLAAVMIVSVVFGGRWRRQAAVLLVVGAVVVIGYYGVVATTAQTHRVTMKDTSGRSSIWTVAGRVIAAHPVLGVGNDNFILVARDYINRPGAIQALYIVTEPKLTHNTYLESLADLGVPGLLTLLAVLIGCLGAAVRAAWIFEGLGDRDMEIFARALVWSIAAVLTSDFFVASGYAKYLWLPLCFCPVMYGFALRALAAAEAADEQVPGPAGRPPYPAELVA